MSGKHVCSLSPLFASTAVLVSPQRAYRYPRSCRASWRQQFPIEMPDLYMRPLSSKNERGVA
jgi:hypothetical protein